MFNRYNVYQDYINVWDITKVFDNPTNSCRRDVSQKAQSVKLLGALEEKSGNQLSH